MYGFDLTADPWLLVRSARGDVREASITEAFEQAQEIRGLVGDVPTQAVAVLRLLLAILRRSFPEARTTADWGRLWSAGRFDMDVISAYLAVHQERFDLLHPTTPFFQVAGLSTAKGEVSSVSRLVADVPAGEQYFTTRTKSGLKNMSFGEAARWVVHAQAFDFSGIKSGAMGDDRVKGGKGYPIGVAYSGWLGLVVVEGSSLFETLMLNLALGQSVHDTQSDLPPWERAPQGPGVESRPGGPTGPVDLMTWQARRIRLAHDGQRVTGVLVANGDPLHPRNTFAETMTSWRLSEAQMKARRTTDPIYMPRQHLLDRAVWRGLEAMLVDTEPAKTRAGWWREWLSGLDADDVLPQDYPIRLRAVGVVYGPQSAVIADIIDDALTLKLAVLTRPIVKALAIDGVHAAEKAARAAGQLAFEVALAGGADRDLAGAARTEARQQAFAVLDVPYRSWVDGLTAGVDREDSAVAWQGEVRRLVTELGRTILDSASDTSWSGLPTGPDRKHPLNAATAANWFYVNLRAALPAAYETPEKGLVR